MGDDIDRAGDPVLEVVDGQTSQWLVRISPGPVEFDRAALVSTPASVAFARSVAEAFPAVHDMVRQVGSLRVAFSPTVQQGLRSGAYRLMDTATGTVPTAVSASTGRTVEMARLVPGTAGLAGGGALGAAVGVSWPLLLAGGVAAAAAMAEQRWLARTIDEVRLQAERIETRLRDDDYASIEAADALATFVADELRHGPVPEQLTRELAAARLSVETVYRSRRRFAERFVADLHRRQDEAERKRGEAMAWVGDLDAELVDPKTGLLEELVLYVQAMAIRARVGAVTAAVLAESAAGGSGMRLLDRMEADLRTDYYTLYRPVGALAGNAPDDERRIPLPGGRSLALPIGRDRSSTAFELIRQLDRIMEGHIGKAIGRVEPVELVIPSDALGFQSEEGSQR